MANFKVNAHQVTACRIVRIEPAVSQGKMLSPDAALILVLDDNSKHQSVADKSGTVVDDWLVHDAELDITFVVSAEKFALMFTDLSAVAKPRRLRP